MGEMTPSVLLSVALLSAPPSVKALSKEARTALGELLDEHADPRTRKRAGNRLVELGEPGVAYALCDALGTEVENLHATIRFVLDKLDAAALFRRELGADDASTREAAARAAGCVAGRETFAALSGALDDPEPEVRAAAADSLARLGDKNAGPALVSRLQDPDANVRSAAAQALAKLQTGCDALAVAARSERDPFAKGLVERSASSCGK